MSEADFSTFYWPTLKAVMKGLVDQGLVPTMFAQGSYNKRLDIIADDELPAGSVIWLLDQTDMAAAKRALGGYACIAGNVPTGLLALASVQPRCEQYVTDLLNTCAKDGGFYLRNGAALDDAKPENLKAMLETGRNWRGGTRHASRSGTIQPRWERSPSVPSPGRVDMLDRIPRCVETVTRHWPY